MISTSRPILAVAVALAQGKTLKSASRVQMICSVTATGIDPQTGSFGNGVFVAPK